MDKDTTDDASDTTAPDYQDAMDLVSDVAETLAKKTADSANKDQRCKTIAELALAVGESESTIKRYRSRPQFPQRDSIGWNPEEVRAYIETRRSESDLKRKIKKGGKEPLDEKRKWEVALLKLRHARLSGTLIPITDHIASIKAYAAVVNGGMEQWISQVAALTHDAKLVGGAEQIRDNIKRKLCEDLRLLEAKK